jgi:hypothetical protein
MQVSSQLKETKFAREGMALDKYNLSQSCQQFHSFFVEGSLKCSVPMKCAPGMAPTMCLWLPTEEQ